MDEIDEVLERQDGVIARRQALACGWTRVDVARMLRRREWVQLHPGVYVNHTGPPTWRQRAWAAVLACWPAALGGWSAVRAHEGPGRRQHDDTEPIEVLVGHGRHPAPLAGVRIRSTRRFGEAVQLARARAMSRLTRRDLILAVLADVAAGTCSVLEHAYLVKVERPHGLPRGLRQVPAVGADGRRMLRDVVHGGRRPRWRQPTTCPDCAPAQEGGTAGVG
ncbi:type IV toxin-antitoxin system AbiEi family antitoxin domain-containing protein [Nocardioides albidus]|uniref:type IV toxin-antitoxin system AbiEi family antitoxin domain-containing protein n=1 Tax=Nocardioides albidus TaxID=1517589 RepID=UPI00196036FD|nr:type IV toxin-antitoxin system AbiEi family antitoxin domain-containing protein [Nocardioides albidus]